MTTLKAAVASRAPSFGDQVKNLRTGRIFTAEIEAVADIEANVVLGRDARESEMFHVERRFCGAGRPGEMRLNDELSALGERFVVLRESDNPAKAQVEYGAMRLTEKDE